MKRQILSMDYYNDFRCIGNKCEDNCCKNWIIEIDKKTYKKYKKLKNSEFKNKLMDNVGRNRKSKFDYDYANINLVNDLCPMLSDEGLCEVYLNIGEENMSYICKTYPRNYNEVDDRIESCLTLSCIEAAQNILLKKDPIEFNLDIKEVEDINVIKKVDTSKPKNLMEKYFNEIRVFSIDLIQNRRFTIEERLSILGLFINNINDIKEDNIMEIIEKYIINIENGTYDNLLKGISYDNIVNAQLEFLTNIYNIILNKNIKDKIYLENLINIVNSLKLDSKDPELIKERFLNSLDNHYKYFIKEHNYIYENYLVNYMFKTLFPMSKMGLLDTYIDVVVHFAIIKMNLIGICEHYKDEMDTYKVVYLIQSFVKVVEHDSFIVDKLYKYLSENELNTIAHMVILMGK